MSQIQNQTANQLGTGELALCEAAVLRDLCVPSEEATLRRVLGLPEYQSFIENNGQFTPYMYAMDIKWFAVGLNDVLKWKDKFKYLDGEYKILEITIQQSMLKYMHYVQKLDNIGPAYGMDIPMANTIIRGYRIYE